MVMIMMVSVPVHTVVCQYAVVVEVVVVVGGKSKSKSTLHSKCDYDHGCNCVVMGWSSLTPDFYDSIEIS